MAKVLVADDEPTMVQIVAELLRAEGHQVFPFTNGNAALEAIETIAPELVITDLYLDRTKAQGLEILEKARALSPPAQVIVITGFPTVETAVDATKKGAYDFLEKPVKLDVLKLRVERALSYNDAVSENVYLRKQLKKRYKFNQLIGSSSGMHEVFKMIERVADTESTVLILGESGTGKELVAKALHYNSRRQFAPFVPVNCSALPENLLESELFGHRRGAFTGAINDKKGLFQEADGGTILLDEIGSMSPLLQSRILRVLQEREVRRVGDNVSIAVNVRVVAATNEPLEKRIKEGTFREDLYYRLNVIPIQLPPLRERRDDIPLLTAHFLHDKIHSLTGLPFKITRQAIEALAAHDWPGNVRELENVIERSCALSETNLLHLSDLPPSFARYATGESSDTVYEMRSDQAAHVLSAAPAVTSERSPTNPSHPLISGTPIAAPLSPLKNFLREQEVNYLNRALAYTGGDKEKAASLLGVSLATLYRKLADEPDAAT
jgi:two-component system, NtrC family, response regulator AtoC